MKIFKAFNRLFNQIQSSTKTYSGTVSQQKTLQSAPKHILPANTSGRTIAKLEVDANVSSPEKEFDLIVL